VVTDDQGRYVVPDLPKSQVQAWVRGYGLVDSPKADGEPGKPLNLRAAPAPTAAAAAQYYPAIHWYSMLRIPAAGQFGGKTNIPANLPQSDWLTVVKNTACIGCHLLGQPSTRTIPAALGEFASSEAAWIRRVQSSRAGNFMLNRSPGPLGGAPFRYVGDWTDRVAKGRAAAQQADAAPRRRAQHRRHDVGVGRPEEIPPRPDRLGSALSDNSMPTVRSTARPNFQLRPDPVAHRSQQCELTTLGEAPPTDRAPDCGMVPPAPALRLVNE
jgi:hypothetical protein